MDVRNNTSMSAANGMNVRDCNCKAIGSNSNPTAKLVSQLIKVAKQNAAGMAEDGNISDMTIHGTVPNPIANPIMYSKTNPILPGKKL